jgi:hypothetical protein
MVALINEDQSNFFDVDSDHFSMSLKMSSEEEDSQDNSSLASIYFGEPFFSISPPNDSSTLQLLHNNKNNLQLTTKGIYCTKSIQ